MSDSDPHKGGEKGIADALLQAVRIFRQEAGLAGATGISFVFIFFGIEGVAKKFLEPSFFPVLDIIAICTLVSGLLLLFVMALFHVIRAGSKTFRLISRYGKSDRREP